jgi:hypothetical protein
MLILQLKQNKISRTFEMTQYHTIESHGVGRGDLVADSVVLTSFSHVTATNNVDLIEIVMAAPVAGSSRAVNHVIRL